MTIPSIFKAPNVLPWQRVVLLIFCALQCVFLGIYFAILFLHGGWDADGEYLLSAWFWSLLVLCCVFIGSQWSKWALAGLIVLLGTNVFAICCWYIGDATNSLPAVIGKAFGLLVLIAGPLVPWIVVAFMFRKRRLQKASAEGLEALQPETGLKRWILPGAANAMVFAAFMALWAREYQMPDGLTYKIDSATVPWGWFFAFFFTSMMTLGLPFRKAIMVASILAILLTLQVSGCVKFIVALMFDPMF